MMYGGKDDDDDDDDGDDDDDAYDDDNLDDETLVCVCVPKIKKRGLMYCIGCFQEDKPFHIWRQIWVMVVLTQPIFLQRRYNWCWRFWEKQKRRTCSGAQQACAIN